eukprot:GHVP01062306.1.p1 GENE.GHVP01062306.1~~GHVP01062306.1.p1  ORF type:complete len:478 (+),score=76.37 GHVP01062306.1:338-1771(+)
MSSMVKVEKRKDGCAMQTEDWASSFCAKFLKLETEMSAVKNKLNKENEVHSKLRSAEAQLNDEIATTKSKKDKLEADHQGSLECCRAEVSFAQQVMMSLQELKSYEARLVSALAKVDEERKKAFNEWQDLKGSIRVMARIRPLLEFELQKGESTIDYTISEDSGSISLRSAPKSNYSRTKELSDFYQFHFDRVFSEEANQKDVYMEIQEFVQSALDGYNVSVFAYGQTGSGKTFTMEGPTAGESSKNKESEGVIQRTVSNVFQTIETLKKKGWNHVVTMSILEIYNDVVKDLLTGGTVCEVRMDQKGNVAVPGLKTEVVRDSNQVREWINVAAKCRSVGATAMNDKSSRSHSILQFNIQRSSNSTTVRGVLNMVDLAGSERVEKSQVKGDRMKEAQNINKSLSLLGDVIAAMGAKREHIPYRNCKLTALLKDSLSKGSKTLMFVNASPSTGSFQETLNSLRFASRVSSCQVGPSKKL